MKKLLWLFILGSCFAQTYTTVTGTVKDSSGTAATSGYVQFQLAPPIGGSAPSLFFSPAQIQCNINGSGQVVSQSGGACQVVMNTTINPRGTYYKVQFCPNNQCVAAIAWYAYQSTQDVSTFVPVLGLMPIIPSYAGAMTWPLSPGIVVYAGSNTIGTSLALPVTSLSLFDATSSVQTQLNGKAAVNANTTGTSGGLSGSPAISVSSMSASGTATAQRHSVANGTALATTDITISAGWGSTASKTVVGKDQSFQVNVTAGGTGIGLYPTITITYKDGSQATPNYVCARSDSIAPFNITFVWTAYTTYITASFLGTPSSGSTYTLSCIGMMY